MNNLFISYDLNKPGKDYTAVIDAIKKLGSWAHVQKSLWYVHTSLTAEQALERVWTAMDASDSLIVVDASNKRAIWRNLDSKVSQHIKDSWAK